MRSPVQRVFGSWWQLPLAVLVLAAVPILLLGEVSGAQVRDRAAAQERDRVAGLAARAAALVDDRIATMTGQLSTVLAVGEARAGSGLDNPRERVLDPDVAVWEIQLSTIKAAMGGDVDRMIVGDGAGDVIASDPVGLAQTDIRGTALFLGWQRAPAKVIRGDTFGQTTDHVTVAVSGFRRLAPQLMAEVPTSRIPNWLAPLNEEVRSVTIADASNVLLAALKTSSFDRASGGQSTARVLATEWTIAVDTVGNATIAQLEEGLARERALRIALAFALLIGAVLLARATSQAIAAGIENARLAEEVVEQSHRIEAAARHKSAFLANMSHELRTPLNAIIGFADVLCTGLAGAMNERQSEYTNDIASAGRHLLSLVNDVLDLSKVEAGRMDLQLREFPFAAALDSDVTLVSERARQHGIAIALDVDPTIEMITADERKLHQVVLNLLSNAVKFTPDGGRVAVHAERQGEQVSVAVSDSGPGIADEDHERIFEEFAQTGEGARKSEGTGLGLTLSKRIVELHGGTIGVQSKIGHGTTFTVTLPLLATWKGT